MYLRNCAIAQLPNALDLESHANHRGSSFGKRFTDQPAQIDFENLVALDIFKKRAAGIKQFVVEDESRLVGTCNVPLELHHGMQRYPLVWLEDRFDNRVERILRDYVVNFCAEFVTLHGEESGFSLFAGRLLQSLDKINKRLGGQRHQWLQAMMHSALDVQQRSGWRCTVGGSKVCCASTTTRCTPTSARAKPVVSDLLASKTRSSLTWLNVKPAVRLWLILLVIR